MSRKEAVTLIYKCINYQCQNLELSEPSWWASFTCNIPNPEALLHPSGCTYTHFPNMYTCFSFLLLGLSQSYFSFMKGEQDEDHFSNKIQTKMFTHIRGCMPLSRIEHLVELRSYLFLEVAEFARWVCIYILNTPLKCRTPKITSERWAEVIHGQKDTCAIMKWWKQGRHE